MTLSQNTQSLVPVDQTWKPSTNYLESLFPCSSNVHREEKAQDDKSQI